MRLRALLTGAVCVLSGMSAVAEASLTRNAAGAKNIGETGAVTVDTGGEWQNEPDGAAWVLETGVQYEVTRRLQFLVEAGLFERQEVDGGGTASGLGDTDVTISWLMIEERRLLPPVVLAVKAKLPTAGEDLGTGRADYSAALILGRESGELEMYLELEFATFGSPPEEDLEDQLIYTLGAEYGLSDVLAVYAEAFGNSAPTTQESRTDAALVGLELDVFATEEVAPYVSLELDTEEAATVRAGVEWAWARETR